MARDVNHELRDIVVAAVRDKPIRSKLERGVLALLIETYWGTNPKADKLLARENKAEEIKQALAGMVAGRRMSAARAKEELARQHGRNSGEALDKWLRRNRNALHKWLRRNSVAARSLL